MNLRYRKWYVEMYLKFPGNFDVIVKKTDSSPNFITKWIGQMRTPKDISNLKHTATAFYSGEQQLPSI